MPTQEMAMPFLVLKIRNGFGFQFMKVLSHFRELVLDIVINSPDYFKRGDAALLATSPLLVFWLALHLDDDG